MEDTGVHVVNDREREWSHLVVPGRSIAVCGASIEGGQDLGVLVVPARKATATVCMTCAEIWSTWRGESLWEGEGPRPDRSREW